MSGTIVIINAKAYKGSIPEEIVSTLLSQSDVTYLLRPGVIQPITRLSEIRKIVKSWPMWHSRPWIIAGRIKQQAQNTPPSYTKPFINDCRGGEDYNSQVTKLLSEFDWAVFSYFTTYFDDIYNFITSDSNLVKILQQKRILGAENETFPIEGVPIKPLKNATFYDYDVEGLFAYNAAMARNEPPPFLLCGIEVNNLDLYYKWNEEKDESEPDFWFKNLLQELEQVEEFIVEGKWTKTKYILFRVNKLEPYLEIWRNASYDYSIAEATLSWDTDISKLKTYLNIHDYSFSVNKDFDEFCTWAYGQIYGGGADEHHAIFRSRESEITDQIWQLAGDEQISRF